MIFNIVAGFVGLNKHCCAFKYAGWRGVFGFLRVHMMRRLDEKYGKNDIPQYDWRMYQEGRKAARDFLIFRAPFVVVGAPAALAPLRTATLCSPVGGRLFELGA